MKVRSPCGAGVQNRGMFLSTLGNVTTYPAKLLELPQIMLKIDTHAQVDPPKFA